MVPRRDLVLLTSPAATYLRARRVPQRIVAFAVTAAACALVARVPVPSLSTDLDAAGYPAVLVAAVGPVLLGVLAAAPAPVRLRWLTAAPGARSRALRTVEFGLVTAGCLLAATAVGWPAGQVGAAMQNAALTQFVAAVLAAFVGPGRATAVVGAAAITLLLVSPGLPPSPWVIVDTLADQADWLAVGVTGLAAAVTTGLGPDDGYSTA